MKKYFIMLMSVMLVLTLAACGKKNATTTTSSGITTTGSGITTTLPSAPTALKINFDYSGSNFISYSKDTPYTMEDGSTIQKGDIKPVFQYMADQVNATLEDVTNQSGGNATAMMQTEATTGFAGADIYGGNSILPDFAEYGPQGYFVPIDNYLDQMPNLSAYFAEYPGIESSLRASDGHIYGLSYVAETGNLARAWNMRWDWVEKLLDSTNPTYDTQAKITVAYTPYYNTTNESNVTVTPQTGVSITKNLAHNSDDVVAQQNAAAVNGQLDGLNACTVLKNYINTQYAGVYDKPSELFLGDKAAYDADELVALMRCVKTNPALLTGDASKNIVIYYARKNTYQPEIIRLINLFGERAFGTDTYGNKFTYDADGNIQYAWTGDEFTSNLSKISDMYKEGLIIQDFDTYPAGATDFRSYLINNDNGFMTYDWIGSTTAFNDSVDKSTMYDGNDFLYKSVLPPVAKWDTTNSWSYFIDNSRSIKPDGWAISTSASPEAITAALKLMDYVYSDMGSTVQNYGVPGVNWTEGQTVTINGVDYPKFTDWAVSQSQLYSGGNMSNYLRDYMGAQYPIGYQKNIGFELQTTGQVGLDSWALLLNSTTTIPTYSATDPLHEITPTIFPYTDDENDVINTQVTAETWITDNIYQIVKYGFNYNDGTIITPSQAGYISTLDDQGISTLTQITQDALDRANGN